MTPHKPIHSRYQSLIQSKLEDLKGDVALIELAIKTSAGIRVADVVWMPPREWDENENETEWPHAPAICVEVHSQSNTSTEMAEKVRLYFEAGAEEVWFCNNGHMVFVNKEGELSKSNLVPEFPAFIESGAGSS